MLLKNVWMLALLATGGAGALAQEVLYVAKEAPFQKGLRVRDNIRSECNLEAKVADDVAYEARNVYKKVTREKPSGGNYHVLSLEIIGVFGAGGGAWSGPKNLEIRGELRDSGGKLLGSFSAERFSMGGVFAGLKGTCKILKRCSRTLGKDVATFLLDPEEGARFEN